ncbi:hypothetical protein PHO31112_05049 [Pandoraea horticolens]|uniref:Uncharacterized protein n=1 Tax=Pandoraea horticolens TaxID=2508298 RepID=A0A5E4Z5W6_9BURK|nr:hypothetical protein PHO31112_05049 [Pandoraea horticolens]
MPAAPWSPRPVAAGRGAWLTVPHCTGTHVPMAGIPLNTVTDSAQALRYHRCTRLYCQAVSQQTRVSR